MNKCNFIGKFTNDPTLNTHSNNLVSTKFCLAIPHKFKKNTKETGSHTAYLDFEAWDSGAKVICSRFKKNDYIIIEAMAKTYDKNTVFRVEHFESLPNKLNES